MIVIVIDGGSATTDVKLSEKVLHLWHGSSTVTTDNDDEENDDDAD